jgi:CPA2 family monovalent cation:H+ antiporter-2
MPLNPACWRPQTLPARAVEQSRASNMNLDIVARAHSDAEVEYLRKCGANLTIMGEREIARGICEHVLSGIGVATAQTDVAPNDTAATGATRATN